MKYEDAPEALCLNHGSQAHAAANRLYGQFRSGRSRLSVRSGGTRQENRLRLQRCRWENTAGKSSAPGMVFGEIGRENAKALKMPWLLSKRNFKRETLVFVPGNIASRIWTDRRWHPKGPSLKETLDWLKEKIPLASNHYLVEFKWPIFFDGSKTKDVSLRRCDTFRFLHCDFRSHGSGHMGEVPSTPHSYDNTLYGAPWRNNRRNRRCRQCDPFNFSRFQKT